MMFWYGPGPGAWAMTLMSIGSLLVLAALAVGLIALVRSLRAGRNGAVASPVASTPETVLATRFARGEISADEYLAALDMLRRTPGRPGRREEPNAG